MLIPLTQGKFAIVDECDSHLLNWKWHVTYYGYAARAIQIRHDRKIVWMHRAILGSPLDNKEIDHINGCKSDNRRSNLRFVTRNQNNQNTLIHRLGRMPGVVRVVTYSRGNKYIYWRAFVGLGQERKRLGNFKTEKLAEEAIKKCSKE